MSIKQYKICPSCKNWNEAKAIECFSCGTDLMNIKPVSREEGAKTVKTEKSETPKGKICTECGFVNAPQSRKCVKCGEDLSDVPVKDIDSSNTPAEDKTTYQYEIISVDGQFKYALPPDMKEFIIGREAYLGDYLRQKLYVSRKHAAIAFDGNQFMIRNLSTTNPTFVDNNELESGKEYTFDLGKEIGLGGKIIDNERQKQAAYLILRIKT